MGRLEGKVALITGAARGQGAAEAALFAAEGASVVITDILVREGERTADAAGCRFLQHDVSSEARWQEVVDQTLAWHGRLDILVNNAGVAGGVGLLNGTPADYERIIAVNQVGVYLGMWAAARPMVAQRSGAIVNISSIAGLTGFGGVAYVASKWAVRGMTKAAAIELAPHGVRVNSIHPGYIDTDMTAPIQGAFREELLRRIPMGRPAHVDEVARLALYLASDESSYSTGSEFVVDGGWTT